MLQEVLVRLWVEGPHTFGIFRQGTSVKKVKELKDAIDNSEFMHGCGLLVVMVTDSLCAGLPVDISEVHIHVLGALLKVLCILKDTAVLYYLWLTGLVTQCSWWSVVLCAIH